MNEIPLSDAFLGEGELEGAVSVGEDIDVDYTVIAGDEDVRVWRGAGDGIGDKEG